MYATREDIRKAAGTLITCGFSGLSIDAELKEVLREVQPSGLILFKRNIESPEQVAELGKELKLYRPENPLCLSVDQEGGRVARIREPATVWPPMHQLGEIGDPELCYRFAQALGREVRAMNFDIDYSPVLDVNSNPDNPIIGDRAFSQSPEITGKCGAAVVKGLHSVGVAAVGKHFPGHGDTDLDSHIALPKVSHELSRLREVEWPPFKAAVDAGLGAIMTAHVVIESIDENVPATFSKDAMDFLRDELNFQGVIMSDDLEMKAVADRYEAQEMAILGMKAGLDHYLVCEKPEMILDFYRALIRAVEREYVSHESIINAAKRTEAWLQRFYQPPVDATKVNEWVGCREHQALAKDIDTRYRMLSM
ncbi:MAG: beta-N-acetylhexosaminidase [Deltaproteobacteria bacterium]|nr:beta-N-acetylhexosaminidase [Deltaproteobacteria bacterium]